MAESGADMIIAIGGGSALDVSKAMNTLSAQDGEPVDYIKGEMKIKRCETRISTASRIEGEFIRKYSSR